jgi:transcriptional regulator GlxA family with amidase domain
MKRVGILIFHEVEVLDFAGPFEVFAITEDLAKVKQFEVVTVSEKDELIRARNGLKVKANHTFADCPSLDLLIVPGGWGAEQVEIHNRVVLDWIAERDKTTEITASVCTGAFLLAKSGVVTDHGVTTHWMDVDDLQASYPALKVERGVKFVDQGRIVTSAGISAGIEMSLHLVGRICGIETAVRTAKRMDYAWTPEYNRRP